MAGEEPQIQVSWDDVGLAQHLLRAYADRMNGEDQEAAQKVGERLLGRCCATPRPGSKLAGLTEDRRAERVAEWLCDEEDRNRAIRGHLGRGRPVEEAKHELNRYRNGMEQSKMMVERDRLREALERIAREGMDEVVLIARSALEDS